MTSRPSRPRAAGRPSHAARAAADAATAGTGHARWLARARGHGQPARGARQRADSAERRLLAQADGFRRPRPTLTGTLAGQIVMEGFLNIRLRPWLRRLVTRLIAIVPALFTVAYYGERGSTALLILSQVVLSLHLPFEVIPLVMFTGDRRKMGALVAPRWMLVLARPVAIVIAGLNVWMIWQLSRG